MEMSEYELIKQEIAIKIDDFNSLFYTTVAVIFTFAFTQKEALVFLVPIIVIIPIYTIRMNEISSMLRMGAYLIVFLEGDEFLWETRLSKYDEKFDHNQPSINPYVFVSIVSFLLCLHSLNYSNIHSKILWMKIIIAILFLIACLYTIKTKRINYKEEKQRYINEWKQIKQEENEDS